MTRGERKKNHAPAAAALRTRSTRHVLSFDFMSTLSLDYPPTMDVHIELVPMQVVLDLPCCNRCVVAVLLFIKFQIFFQKLSVPPDF